MCLPVPAPRLQVIKSLQERVNVVVVPEYPFDDKASDAMQHSPPAVCGPIRSPSGETVGALKVRIRLMAANFESHGRTRQA
jgi:hypothetical protein